MDEAEARMQTVWCIV